MRIELVYFDQSGNKTESKQSAEFYAVEVNGGILEYFTSEEAALNAMSLCVDAALTEA